MPGPSVLPCEPHRPTRVDDARAAILNALTPIRGHACVALRDALDRILTADVTAPFDVPAHDNSAMDGYALRHTDLSMAQETTLSIVGTAFAGRSFSGLIGPGQAVRIMTGAVLPQGADCIVPQEDTHTEGDCVRIPAGQKLDQHIRRAGEDLARGKPAIAAGTRLGPAEIGLLASLGIAEVHVRRRLRVAFFSTGDEIASIGKTLAPGEIYDSNRYTLWSSLTRMGMEVIDLGVVRDTPEDIEATMAAAAREADVILTSGGVSVGEADFIKQMMQRLGSVDFWRIAIKPGRPMAFGRIGEAWLFGLPGNPVAVMVNFHQFVADALQKLAGRDPLPVRPTFAVPCCDEIKKSAGRREFPRGILFQDNGTWQVRLAGSQGSGVLRSMSEANCYIVLPEERGTVRAGEPVDIQLFEGLV